MKKLIIAVISTLVATSAFAQMSIEDRVGELEAERSLNYFKFSGMLQTQYDNYVHDDDTAGVSPMKLDYHRMRASLNLDADVSPDISFYSRLTTTKVFNEYTHQGGTAIRRPAEFSEGREYTGGSLVYLEISFAEVRLGGGFVLSMGRLPTIDGPMTHFPNGKARQGTYPGMIYNAVLDGYGLSYNANLSDSTLSARFIYTPMTYWNKGYDVTGPFYAQPTVDGKKANTIIELNSLMIEWNKANAGWARNLSVIYQTYQTGSSHYDGALYDPSAAVCASIRAGVVGTVGAGNADTIQAECNAATGLNGAAYWKILAQNLTFMADSIGGTGFDLGISYVTTETQNDESIYFHSATLDTLDATTGTGDIDVIKGLATSTKNSTVKGSGMLISTKYNFGSTYAGLEYVSNEKGNFVYGNAFEDLAKFYGTTGTGTHIYVGHKIKPELTGRIGIYNQTFKTTGFTFGPQTDYANSPKNTVTYANLRLDF